MGAHRKSIVKEAVDRLEEKMAIRQSRGKAKAALRAAKEMGWTGSTERIHSFKTRSVYQGHVVRFVRWVRTTYQIKDLAQVDARADELATRYLQWHLEEGKSAYTLQAERSALRLFFGDRSLAQQVVLPRRTRATITRSRGIAAHDRHFQAANWQPLLRFLQATGLRRNEVRLLLVCDIVACEPEGDYQGQTTVKVRNGKGGKSRTVPVLMGHERDVLCLREGRQDDEPVFARIPKHLDVHSYRRAYAQALYLSLAPGRSLPPQTGRLRPSTYDTGVVMAVSKALGHRRKDVVLHHYLR
ncbi:MAG TPA: site-specific integrase [Ktedonobacteraceae bacterium]|jgi:integrase|nr:site-specific integrase [Ktedonobacteraceae bacterium]